MFLERPLERRIDRYAGPYERWVYSEELGLPFAFKAIRYAKQARHFAAILEGVGQPADVPGAKVRVPPLWPSKNDKHLVTPFAFQILARDDDPANLMLDELIALRLDPLRGQEPEIANATARFQINMPMAADSWVPDYRPDAGSESWLRRPTPPSAILGVIDDGLPFAHRAFLGSDGRTRISHVWLQSAQARTGWDRVPFGREFTNGEIDALRASHGPDERRLYRAVGAIDRRPEIGRALERHSTHGAHILGLAGGNGLFGLARRRDAQTSPPPLGDDVQIVAVQLPNTIAWDTSGFGKEMFMLSALHYIFVRASEIAQEFGGSELPLVVNFSYGWSAGRHDGGSAMELAIEELIQRRRLRQPKTEIVVPTGNNFADGMHATFSAEDMSKGSATIGWRLRPDDRTASYLEIWFPESFDPVGWEVRLVPPRGMEHVPTGSITIPDLGPNPVGDPQCFSELDMNGQNLAQLSADRHRGSPPGQLSADHHPGARWRVMIAVIPTAEIPTTEMGKSRRLPPGLWTVVIDRKNLTSLGADQVIDLWLQRDDDPRPMSMGGRQSRLERLLPHARPPRRSASRSPVGILAESVLEGQPGLVRGYGSLSALATTPSALRVAGVVATTRHATGYSSAGALRREGESLVLRGEQPTLAAAADQGAMLRGLPSIGCVSGSRSRLVGTSAAAALAARWMVANAAAGREFLHGLAPYPPLKPDEDEVRRVARLGTEGIVPIGLWAT
jgi:hypothetical protein